MRNILLALFALACYTFAAEKASLDFQASQAGGEGLHAGGTRPDG